MGIIILQTSRLALGEAFCYMVHLGNDSRLFHILYMVYTSATQKTVLTAASNILNKIDILAH